MNFGVEFLSQAVPDVQAALGSSWSVAQGWQANAGNEQQATLLFTGATAEVQQQSVAATSGTYNVSVVLQAPQSKVNEAAMWQLLPSVNQAMLGRQLRFIGATCGVEDEQDRVQVLEANYTIPSLIADGIKGAAPSK